MSFKFLEKSSYVSVVSTPSCDKINIVSQFFVSPNPNRSKEIRTALEKNVQNQFIDKIYLLNERLFTNYELGVESDKIQQVVINKRLKFSDFFEFTQNNITGFNILTNIDIFFDDSINNLKTSDITSSKKMFSVLRREYRGQKDLNLCNIYGSTQYYKKVLKNGEQIPNIAGSPASFDSWIIHSNNKLTDKEIGLFKFELGKQGCDNKIIYLFKILGYDIYNDTDFIKSYHCQKEFSKNRDYTLKDSVLPPWGLCLPASTNTNTINFKVLDVDITETILDTNALSFHHFTNDNITLKNYITDKINNNEKFLIPRIAGIENVFAYLGACLLNGTAKWDFLKYNAGLKIMKKNAGIKLINDKSIIKYSQCYCRAFADAELYASWECYGDVRKAIKTSHDFITNTFKKQQIWGYTFDIFHYIYDPWTVSLAGKRLLIISPFVESIQEKIHIREKIYGKDLFPGCSFGLMKPPQTQGEEESEEFDVEFNKFCNKLMKVKDDFDVALVSCGGYGNPVCAFIYNHLGKSAIYLGGVLQMYFGIYGERWMRERKDIMRLYLNPHWSRPKDSEKPKAAKEIENNCYW